MFKDLNLDKWIGVFAVHVDGSQVVGGQDVDPETRGHVIEGEAEVNLSISRGQNFEARFHFTNVFSQV